MLLSEKALSDHGMLIVELQDDLQYRLKYGDVVEYRDGRRIVNGRASPYEFRSVEQLRYDFEKDVRAEGGSLG